MNSQESDPGGGVRALCWVGEVGDEQQVTVASGCRSLSRHRAQTLLPREGGCTGSM